jgi:hypothetical protein
MDLRWSNIEHIMLDLLQQSANVCVATGGLYCDSPIKVILLLHLDINLLKNIQ